MDFEQKLSEMIKERGASKCAISGLIDMNYNTFLYKAKRLDRWNVIEFNKLAQVLRLTKL